MAKEETKLIQPIKEWRKVEWVVIKKNDTWVFVECDGWVFTAIILQKEVRDLERNKVDLSIWTKVSAELINPEIKHKEWYLIISISKLLQVDVWNNLIEKANTEEIMTVVPTEANLWWLLIDMHGIKWFIPLSQLAPIHYPRVEDGDQEAIFNKLLALIGKEFKVKVISIDEEEKRIILSEREALKEETNTILESLEVWNTYKWVVSGLSSYGFFVTLWWSVEWLVHISEITYWHVDNIDRIANIWDPMEVKVIWLENGKISLSSKQLKEDPWAIIKRTYKIGDTIEWEVIRFVPYGVFIRMYDDINGLIHLSELTDKGIDNPAEAVKLGQVVKTKIIMLDFARRKIWLSMRALFETADEAKKRLEQKKQQNQRRFVQRRNYVRRDNNATTSTTSESKHEVKKYVKSEKEVAKKEVKKVEKKEEAKSE